MNVSYQNLIFDRLFPWQLSDIVNRFESTLVIMRKTITISNSVSLVRISQKTQQIFILKVMPLHKKVIKVDKKHAWTQNNILSPTFHRF